MLMYKHTSMLVLNLVSSLLVSMLGVISTGDRQVFISRRRLPAIRCVLLHWIRAQGGHKLPHGQTQLAPCIHMVIATVQ